MHETRPGQEPFADDVWMRRIAADRPRPLAIELPNHAGRYEVLREIGRGGMGVVYAAYDTLLGRNVALKLPRDDGHGRDDHAHTVREARALARLSHPNVVQLYEVGKLDERIYLAMELIEGVDVRAWLQAAPRSLAEILAVFLQVADGLAAAHAAGLVLRDFKPDNLLLGADGRVRVVDFGLARLGADDPAGSRGESGADLLATSAEARHGTPAYMAPEQHLGIPPGAAADIYSYAVSLYEAVHGERPFAAAEPAARVEGLLRGETEHVPAWGEVPRWLHAAIVRGMALEPADRWPSMQMFAAALRARPRGRAAVRRFTRARVAGLLA